MELKFCLNIPETAVLTDIYPFVRPQACFFLLSNVYFFFFTFPGQQSGGKGQLAERDGFLLYYYSHWLLYWVSASGGEIDACVHLDVLY